MSQLARPLRRPADEAELLARAIEHDAGAIRLILEHYNRRLYRIARSVVRDDSEAEDIVQAAYGSAFTHLEAFEGNSSLGTWLGRIVLNEAFGRLRKRRKTIDQATGDHLTAAGFDAFQMQSSPPDPERLTAQREINRLIEAAVDALPDRFRTVLVARAIEGLSVEETAALLGIRAETVKTRLHRARALLRSKIEPDIGPSFMKAFPFAGQRCARITAKVLDGLLRPESVAAQPARALWH